MDLLDKVNARVARRGASRGPGSRKDFAEPPFWAYDNLTAPLLSSYSLTGAVEKIETNFEGYVESAYKANGVVFAVMLVRQWLFAEARFQWRMFRDGRPGQLFGSQSLRLLERPWPTGTTGELLARMEVTASAAGNYYATTADDQGRLGRAARGEARIVHMRPDWTDIVIDSASGDPWALDARVVAYSYQPPPRAGITRPEPTILLPDEVVHYSPIPDPTARFRGMSWLTPIVEEIRADKAATLHKSRFFANGATPNMAIKFDKETSPDTFEAFVARFKELHQGADKAYKTLFLAGGADPVPLSLDFKQLDFKATTGVAETRIAAAGRVHPTLVGLSEGLQGSSLNAGNFTAAARITSNITMRPLWRMASASLQTLVRPPAQGAELWYDDRDIAFLHEDATDQADIQVKQAQALRQLVDGGWHPDAAVDFVRTNDLNRLMSEHSGLLSVQMQPPGSGEQKPPGQAAASENGRVNGNQVAVRR